jgi:hypothetical protein
VRRFLEGSAAVELCIDCKEDRYAWVQTTLLRFHYLQLSKVDKAVLLSFLQKISGYSQIQVKRLVKQYCKTGCIQRRDPEARGGLGLAHEPVGAMKAGNAC